MPLYHSVNLEDMAARGELKSLGVKGYSRGAFVMKDGTRTLDPFNHDGMSVAEARRRVEALKQKAVS
jgi:hypothetical protein